MGNFLIGNFGMERHFKRSLQRFGNKIFSYESIFRRQILSKIEAELFLQSRLALKESQI